MLFCSTWRALTSDRTPGDRPVVNDASAKSEIVAGADAVSRPAGTPSPDYAVPRWAWGRWRFSSR